MGSLAAQKMGQTRLLGVRLSFGNGLKKPAAPTKFGHGRHVIGVLGKVPKQSGCVESHVDFLDQMRRSDHGMGHPSILAKQDRQSALKVKTVGLPRTDSLVARRGSLTCQLRRYEQAPLKSRYFMLKRLLY